MRRFTPNPHPLPLRTPQPASSLLSDPTEEQEASASLHVDSPVGSKRPASQPEPLPGKRAKGPDAMGATKKRASATISERLSAIVGGKKSQKDEGGGARDNDGGSTEAEEFARVMQLPQPPLEELEQTFEAFMEVTESHNSPIISPSPAD